jgi:5-methyltetrahydrofolate--homocysteine methyltransferase
MPTVSLREKINQGLLLLDGGMGTELIARGIEIGTCNDYLNVESPDMISDIQRAYLQAGSDAVITNTFGANRYALARHDLAEQATQINQAGARIARQVAGEENYVLGDIGPSGDFLEPLGTRKPDELRQAFTEQAEALRSADVDGFIIETMTALDEMTVAVEAVKSVSSGLPVLVSMSFDKAADGFRTMMGVDVEAAISKIVTLDVDAVGFNCGTASLDEYVELAELLVATTRRFKDNLAVSAEPNAGKPELTDGRPVYKVSPDAFAAAAEKIRSAGVSIIGGCCGTTPSHIQAMAKSLR